MADDRPGAGLRIAPEPGAVERAAIHAALERAAAGRARPDERTDWWREGLRANLRPQDGR